MSKIENLIHTLIKNMTNTISDLENQLPQWISVKDRLPEVPDCKGFLEIIISSYSDMRKLRVSNTAYFREGNFYDHCDDKILIDDGYWELTHWMYLPELLE